MTAAAQSPPKIPPQGPTPTAAPYANIMDMNLTRALDELAAAQSEIDDMAMRNIVAAETVELISTLVKGGDGDAISEVAGTILEACTLADVIGQRLMKISRALETAQGHMASLSCALNDAGVKPPLAQAERQGSGVHATGPALSPPNQADIDALFG